VMRFKKPPVVEVWISFDFDPNENKREWDLQLVQKYIEIYKTELPKVEAQHEKQIQVKETSPTDLPKVVGQQVRLQFVRLSNEDRSRVLQLGDDHLSYHVSKIGDDYPGYQKVRDETQLRLEDYIKVFQPSQVRNATLHYLDIIDIPSPEDGKIDLGDFFNNISTDLPEKPFGLTSTFSVQFQVKCTVDEGPLLLQLMSIPASSESNVFRFRLEWHKLSIDINTLDYSQVLKRLDVTHTYMTDCFLASFTKRTLDMFEPVEEN
jgi:uncharacterized protein (TIGR04255 family)